MSRQRRSEPPRSRRKPASTPEAREQELSAVAHDLAEEQMRKGTASSQVITFFLKSGSMREQLEQQRIAHEIELMEAKQEQIRSQKRVEDLYVSALEAMRAYSGLESGSIGELDPGDEG